jgi:acid phosphatase type 7
MNRKVYPKYSENRINNDFQTVELTGLLQLRPDTRRIKKKRAVRLLMIFVLVGVMLQNHSIPPLEASAASVVLVGAGDIASCAYHTDEATAKLLDNISGMVFTTGDNVYTHGTYTQYLNCYHPTWGRHSSRTRPVPGNHEYLTAGAAGYFRYFFGYNPRLYYAYNLGDWRIYALNSNIDVSATSAQVKWLKADLTANPKKCVLAYWHHPRWSSGAKYGNSSTYQALWETLYLGGAELVLNGHEHHYERFAQMNTAGVAVSSGLREIVVGTGGASLYGFGTIRSASEVRNSSTHGVLKLALSSTSYSWQFIPVAGKTFTDSGATLCH